MVSGVASSPTMLRLPALARQQIIDDLAASSSRRDVWQGDDPRVWAGSWSELLDPVLYENGLKLLPSPEVGGTRPLCRSPWSPCSYCMT